jgi:MFS family permease
VLGEREFSLYFAARALSLFGGAFAPIAIAFAIIDLTGSATDLGLVLAAFAVPQVVFMLVGGVVADRLPRHHVMVISDVVRGVAQLTLAVLLFTDAAEVWMFVVVSAVNGTAAAFFYPASQGIIPQIVSGERLQEANALLRSTHSVVNIAGAAIGGIVVATIGSSAAIAIDSATYLIGALLLGILRVPPLPMRATRFITDFVEGWREFTAHTWLWAIVIAFGVVNASWLAGMFVLGPLVAERDLGGPAAWGFVLAGLSAGFVAGGVAALYLKPRRPLRATTFGCAAAASPLLGLAVDAPLIVVVGAAALGGFGLQVADVNWGVTLQTHIASDKLGRINAYDAFGSFILNPVSYAAIGPVAAAVGVRETLAVCILIILVTALTTIAIPSVWSLQRRTAPEAMNSVQPG